ncbi:MAG: carbohydrate kinase family protein [Ruminococcaceae bacterium]|nr:carbohydrate kinase family protein [Oscillospiraceae bacterium]
MSRILVCGLVNMETTVSVDFFPIEYRPVDYRFFGVSSHPAGVGFNLSLALNTLGDDVVLCSFTGDDSAGEIIRTKLEAQGISTNNVLCKNKSTAQSVILYDKEGRRNIICDLADNQDLQYDEDVFVSAIEGCDIACMCNINYSAGLLHIAKNKGVLIASDVHCLSDIHDEYNARFMRVADILFISNENFMGREQEFVTSVADAYNIQIIVVGMGSKGALLYTRTDNSFIFVPAVSTRPVKNTVGAGDSLFSSFIHFYAQSKDPLDSLQKAVYFASYKIGDNGASKGFLTEKELLELITKEEV